MSLFYNLFTEIPRIHVKNKCSSQKATREEIEWHSDSAQEENYNKLKDIATKTQVLAFCKPKESLKLNVDASAVIMQKEKHIAYASRDVNPTQQKYSQIEKETLAIVFGCEKFQNYEIMNHKPLESILESKSQKLLHAFLGS